MSCFDRPSEVRINRIEVEASQSPPSQIAKLCGYKEVNLGYFPYVYHRIENLKSGDKLIINGEGLADIRNQLILKFSKNFSLEMDRYKKLGYVPVEAKVHFVAFWKNVETGIETKIVLPEIVLERKKDDSVQF
jgi:ATP-dependent DNA helicase RecQ